MIRIGEKIMAVRKSKGWTQEYLGWKTSVSTQAMSKWKSKKSGSEKEHLKMLSGLLNVSFESLSAIRKRCPGMNIGKSVFQSGAYISIGCADQVHNLSELVI